MRIFFRLSVILALSLALTPHARAQTNGSNTSASAPLNNAERVISDPLVRVLITKAVLTTEEGRAVSAGGTPTEQRDRLAALLRDKGLISAAEVEAIRTVAPTADASASARTATATEKSEPVKGAPQAAATPSVIAAVAPVRLLSIDPPKREGLIPDIKLGSGARVKLYGFFKTSVNSHSLGPAAATSPTP